MIVVVGPVAWRPIEPAGVVGRAAEIALAAAAGRVPVELVARVGDDPAGDSLAFALSGAGVGHAALLRDPARPTPVIAAGGAGDGDSRAGAPAELLADERPHRVPMPPGAPCLQRADVELGLSYLGSVSVVVIADDAPPEVIPAAVDGAAFAGAHLVVLLAEGRGEPAALPPGATVLAAPNLEDDGAFAGVVAAYALALVAGRAPADAFRDAIAAGPWAVTQGELD